MLGVPAPLILPCTVSGNANEKDERSPLLFEANWTDVAKTAGSGAALPRPPKVPQKISCLEAVTFLQPLNGSNMLSGLTAC